MSKSDKRDFPVDNVRRYLELGPIELSAFKAPMMLIGSAVSPTPISSWKAVAKVGEGGGRIYLNFADDWRRDFTISVERKDVSAFAAAGLDLK
jgi:hypothetical protein